MQAAQLLGAADFIPSPEQPIGWRGDGSGVYPAATPPITWSDGTSRVMAEVQRGRKKRKQWVYSHDPAATTTNILWRRLLPNWSNSAPVVAGKRVFVLCESVDAFPLLLCFNTDDGQELWRLEISPLVNDDAETRQRIRSQWMTLTRLARELAVLIHARLPHDRRLKDDPMDAKSLAFLQHWQEQAKEFAFTEFAYTGSNLGSPAHKFSSPVLSKLLNRAALTELRKHGCGFPCWDTGFSRGDKQLMTGAWTAFTHATPVTDGRHIWVSTGFNTVACIDMDGALVWSRRLGPAAYQGVWYNYLHSPILVGGHIMVSSNEELVALQADTGDVAWRHASPFKKKGMRSERARARSGPLATGVPLLLQDEWYFFWDDARVYRVRDGKQSSRCIEEEVTLYGGFSPVVKGTDVICAVHELPKQSKTVRRLSFRVQGEAVVCKELWRDGADADRKSRWGARDNGPMDAIWLPDRLYVGIASQYKVERWLIIDPSSGKDLAPGFTMPCSRLAGPVAFKDGLLGIYSSDNDAATITLVDWDGKQLAENHLSCAPLTPERERFMIGNSGGKRFHSGWGSGSWHCSPCLVGDRMYIRSRSHLFCIGKTP